MFERLCLIGIGLIGGSIARTVRKRGLCHTIVGFDQNQVTAQKAVNMGIIDSHASTITEAAVQSDLIIIATPVGAAEGVLIDLRGVWSDQVIYTDVGSTKKSFIDAAQRVFGHVPPNLIPGHPVAGAEESGVQAAVDGLFDRKRIILTPLSSSRREYVDRVHGFWRAMGASVSEMTVDHHDAVLAATSHFPHILAYALTDLLGRKDEKKEILKFAAGGFKDFSRIASSDPQMWRDICLANSGAILQLIKEFQQELDDISQVIEDQEGENLVRIFQRAQTARGRFLEQYSNI